MNESDEDKIVSLESYNVSDVYLDYRIESQMIVFLLGVNRSEWKSKDQDRLRFLEKPYNKYNVLEED